MGRGGGYAPLRDPDGSKMALVNGRRALRRRWGRRPKAPTAPPRFWGRIGVYEAVTREGMLLLLAPEPAHPSRRVTSGA